MLFDKTWTEHKANRLFTIMPIRRGPPKRRPGCSIHEVELVALRLSRKLPSGSPSGPDATKKLRSAMGVEGARGHLRSTSWGGSGVKSLDRQRCTRRPPQERGRRDVRRASSPRPTPRCSTFCSSTVARNTRGKFPLGPLAREERYEATSALLRAHGSDIEIDRRATASKVLHRSGNGVHRCQDLFGWIQAGEGPPCCCWFRPQVNDCARWGKERAATSAMDLSLQPIPRTRARTPTPPPNTFGLEAFRLRGARSLVFLFGARTGY